jgi:ferredoxin-thioredoxin reductase catalytic chain
MASGAGQHGRGPDDCLLFVTPEGLPITEHLPDGHEGRTTYGLVLDPTPLKGREGRDGR